jgi:hypothetical protein
MPQHWIYPVNPASDYYIVDSDTGAQQIVNAENLWDDIPRRGDQLDDWFLSTGYRSMLPGDLVWIYEAGLRKAVIALGHAQRIYLDNTGWHVDLRWDQSATAQLRRAPIQRQVLGQTAQSQVRANATARGVLDGWLATHTITSLTTDPIIDAVSDEDARTKVLASIYRRRGQQAFRLALLDAYSRRCAITGCTAVDVLEAAHIKPYRGDHTNVLTNGLLLRADVHTLFDLNLIALEDSGKVVVSSKLDTTEYSKLAGTTAHLPMAARVRPLPSLLKSHRRKLKK